MPGLILLTFWSLIVPSIVIGGTPAMSSFGQSWRTVRGHAWRVFGTFVLVFLIDIVFKIVLSRSSACYRASGRSFISSIVSGTLIAPFLAIVVSLIYYRLTAAHQNQGPPPGYPEPGYPEYPPPGYGNAPQGGYGNVPPASYGSPGPGETPARTARTSPGATRPGRTPRPPTAARVGATRARTTPRRPDPLGRLTGW